ncbi:uncharacterized protein [Salminus brasiliensis]|uniref:uncharacterized protein n=1 Tax=Salminus brasiliensis TaxID=930266 RepID=UPI003B83312F
MLNLLGHLRVKREGEAQTTVTTSSIARDFSSTAAPFLSTLALISSTMNAPQQQANHTASSPPTSAAPTPPTDTTAVTITTTPGTTTPATTTSATSFTATSSPTTNAATKTTNPAITATMQATSLPTFATPGTTVTTPTTFNPAAIITSAITQLQIQLQNSPTVATIINTAPPTSDATSPHTTANPSDSASTPTTKESTVSVQCNLFQICNNKTSCYWMLVSVEVPAAETNKSEQDVKTWFSTLNQNSSTITLQVIGVNCGGITDFKTTDCTVMMKLTQPSDSCTIRQLLQQKSGNSSLHVKLLGEVARVGRNLCLEKNMSSPGDVFVFRNSSMPSSEICAEEAPVSVACSFQNRGFIPYGLNIAPAQSYDNNTQYYCNCNSFCNRSEAFYGFSLNIMSRNVTFDDVKNTITQLDCPCNSTVLPSLCNVSSHYQRVNIQCCGDGTRLYSCLVALQLSQPLDVCTISEALAALLQSSTLITYNGTLTRLALCGLPSDGAPSLLNANLTWGSANISAKQICALNQPSLITRFTW